MNIKADYNKSNSLLMEKPSVEIRGIIYPCTREFRGIEKDGVKVLNGQKKNHKLITKCSTKLYVDIKITNRGLCKSKDQFILLDHVYDPSVNMSSRMLNPIVIRLKQEQILQVYDLKFLKHVNGEAKETVHLQSSHSRKCGDEYLPCGSKHSQIHHKNHGNGLCCCCDVHLPHDSKLQKKDFERSYSHQVGLTPLHTDTKESQYYEPNSEKLGHVEYTILPDIPNVSPIATIPNEQYQIKSIFPYKGDNIFGETPSIYKYSTNNHEGKSWHQSQADGKEEYSFTEKDIEPHTMHNAPFNKLKHSLQPGEDKIDGNHVGTSFINENKDIFFKEKNSLSNKMNSGNSWNAIEDGKTSSENINNAVNEDLWHKNQIPTDTNNNKKKSVSLIRQYSPESVDTNEEYEFKTQIKCVKNDNANSYPNINFESKMGLKSKDHKHTSCIKQPKGLVVHCLKFSDQWYAVYDIKKHSYKHVIHLQVFEKNYNSDGSNLWLDHTKGKMISLGSSNEPQKTPVILNETVKYQVLQIEGEQNSIYPKSHKLLVPQSVSEPEMMNYAEVTGNPAEFLVLDEELISLEGTGCDKAGINIEAFISKKGRCGSKPGTCLKNQPTDLWRQDKENKRNGEKVQYLLERFGHVTRNAFKINKMNGKHSLSLEFHGKHVSQVDVVVPSAFNQIVHKGMPAQITSIVVDASKRGLPILSVSVTNLGLASSLFMVMYGKCSPPLKSRKNVTGSAESPFCTTKSKKLMISSLHQAVFKLGLDKDFLIDRMFCIVKVVNDNNQVVAARRVTIWNDARCICLWHCECRCIKSIIKLKCKLMPLSEIHAAGLIGAVPIYLPTTPVEYLVIFQNGDNANYLCFFLLCLLLMLLLLGCNKALLGLTFCKSCWTFGLPYYCGPKDISEYREPELSGRQVQFDECGYPIHPDTKKRTVHLYNRWLEFILNLVIFLVFPLLALCWWPICWCYCVIFKNFIGLRWKYRASKKNIPPSQNASETSAFNADRGGDRTSSSNRKSSTPGKSENVSLSSINGRTREFCTTEGSRSKSRSTGQSTKTGSGSKRLYSVEITQMARGGSGRSIMSQKTDSKGDTSTLTSHVSIETYDGTDDERENVDVNYVLKQLRRSTTDIRKLNDKFNARKENLTQSEDDRLGEVHQELESSTGMESSSEESIAVDPIVLLLKNVGNSRSPSNKPVGSRAYQADTYSEVTTKDSLEAGSDSESKSSLSSAEVLVQKLNTQKNVFRNLFQRVGQVSFPPGRPYSIRGYFLRTDVGYKFLPPTPLWQYWTVDEDGINIQSIDPPKVLYSSDFERDYKNAQSVADAGDLSEEPLSICINVQYQGSDDDEN